HQGDQVRAAAAGRDLEFVLQEPQLGTGHAVQCAAPLLGEFSGAVAVLAGDAPLIRSRTLVEMMALHRETGAMVTILTARVPDPSGYGRIIRNREGKITGIVEEKDCLPEQRLVDEINSSIYAFDYPFLSENLSRLGHDNRQGEYYLTDLVGILRREGKRVAAYRHPDSSEILGVNHRADLALALGVLRRRKCRALMLDGVTLLDPDNTYIDHDVEVGTDTVIYPGTHLEGKTRIGPRCLIGPGCHIIDSTLGPDVQVLGNSRIQDSRIQKEARIGPFAHLRPGSSLGQGAQVGNFVETKKTTLGKGSKANHHAYLGDAEIGREVNIGAGTITCNFDGTRKHRTIIEDLVFIGSDTQLVAPVRIRRGAYVGAGSTITQEVPPYSLAISRCPQTNKEGWVRTRAGAGKTRNKRSKPRARKTTTRRSVQRRTGS
ncbi:MAG: bifunctional UDP-N-acetylglucosamine diphosphorylase/glucosamine-1-phosphate N-acetyltransferase GlmU, partial [Acidobacteriota bacterium]